MMREKQSGSAAVEVCDICGDVGVLYAISYCFDCKISKQHFYCGKNYPHNIHEDWYCDHCEKKTKSSPKHVNEDLHKTVVSNVSARVHDENTHSAHNRRRLREERMVTKGKVKCIASAEVIKLSSGSKKGESPVKTIGRPVYRKIPLLQLNTPSPLPVTKPINHSDHAGAKNATAVKEPSMQSEGLCGRSPKKQFRPPNIIVSAVVETQVATPGIEIYKSSKASNALSLEMQFPQPINSDSGTKNATAVKETSLSSEALCGFTTEEQTSLPSEAFCGFPTEKQFLPPVSPVRASAEVKVATQVKEIHKANETSDAVSLEKQVWQPIGSDAATKKDRQICSSAELS